MLAPLLTSSPVLRLLLLLLLPPLFGEGSFSAARDRDTERFTPPPRFRASFPPLPGLRLLEEEVSFEGTLTVRLLLGGCWRFTEAAGRTEDEEPEDTLDEDDEDVLVAVPVLPPRLRLVLRLSLVCPLGPDAALLIRLTLLLLSRA